MMPHPIDLYIGLKSFFSTSTPPCKIWLERPYDFHVIELGSPIPSNSSLYVLTKVNIDTFNAINILKKKFGGHWSWAGLKDARAITLQLVSSNVHVDSYSWNSSNKCLYIKRIGSGDVKPGTLNGNSFVITLRANCKIHDYVLRIMDELGQQIPGIYGYQRFGTKRPISHIIGKLILQEKWDEAVDVLLGEPTPWESEKAREIRKLYYEMGPSAYLHAPKFLNIERRVAFSLLKGKSSRQAIVSLPQFRLFINAFQAYVYNKALTSDVDDLSRYSKTPGFNSWEVYKELFLEEGINRSSLKKFKVRGTPRKPLVRRNVIVRSLDNDVVLAFSLPKGYFATALLREIIKGDPKGYD